MSKALIIEGHTISYWAETLGISPNTLIWRHARGYPPEKILSVEKFRTEGPVYEVDGKIYSGCELEKMYGIDRRTIKQRYKKGVRGKELINPVKHSQDFIQKKSEKCY